MSGQDRWNRTNGGTRGDQTGASTPLDRPDSRAAVVAAALVLLLAPASFASVGKVAALEGSATRTSKEGARAALAVGSAIELEDTLEVTKGNLKLQLNDQSVLIVGEGSRLRIDEASFAGQERQGFSAKLLFGKIWAKVSKAVGGAKFEVKTERAVAGVRGTIFRVDADRVVSAAMRKKTKKPVTVVSVQEGRVAVTARVKKSAAARNAPPPKKGERKQIAPPFHQISKDEWEEKFVELQANQKVIVGEDLWEQAALDASDQQDAFADFVRKNQ